ncbi:DUF4340 domain-containing protein [Haloferula sp.]|uniref:DUF4340 domain-containing protein n=1 Tax=Haloferula sp. TaxID=2497595 RepID=UPI00329DD12A
MRSVVFTLFLSLLAFVSVGLAAIRMADGSLARVFGAPATKIGDELYDFDSSEVNDIALRGNGVSAYCKRSGEGWMVVSPWEDRMDPRIAQKLVTFTLASRVEGALPIEKVESNTLSLDDGWIGVRISDKDDEPLSKYVLGRRTAWLGTDAETGETIPTIFVQPRDKNRKDYIYACTDPDDIHSLLTDGFKRLRDHHPFLFHPTIVQSLRIKNRNGELLLSRNQPKEMWKIVKPLELKSDRDSLVRLLQGLYDLEAIKVMSRSEVTLPTDDPAAVDQIALRFFGRTEEIVLEIYPPETPDSPTVLARVSDRPNAVFELLRNSTPATENQPTPIALADLPLSVNDLRDPTLTSINPAQIQGILIASANSENIFLKRDHPKARFEVMLGGEMREPNETALFSLLKTITEGKVAGFVSDTATDLEPYGLDKPFLSLRFLGFDDSVIQLDFSQNKEGEILAIRGGTTTVFRIDPAMIGLIPLRSWEWRDTQLWGISEYDVQGIVRKLRDQAQLTLTYKAQIQDWRATEGSEDRTPELAKDRANRFLKHLTGLNVRAWLRPDHEAAHKALANPDMEISIQATEIDKDGNDAGFGWKHLTIGSVPVGKSRIYYGSVKGESNPFTITEESFELLSVDLFSFD